MPKIKSSKSVSTERFPLKLTPQQRESLIAGTRLQSKFKTLLKKLPEGTRIVELTQQQLDHLDDELATAAQYVRHPHKARIEAVHRQVNKLLEGLLNSAPTGGLRSQRPDGSKPLFQFKIVLRDVSPAIWRRIQVEDCTLAELHEYIQVAMGWKNYHMHQFTIDGERYGMMSDEIGFFDFCEDLNDEEEVRISELLPTSARRVRWRYEYDFGDGWEHDIVFEGYPVRKTGEKYPVCTEGERACPPEDCGGSWGYVEMVEAVSDPEHEQHDELLEWWGPFDPEKFELPKMARRSRRR